MRVVLLKGVAFSESRLIKGVAFSESRLIKRGGL